MQGGQNPLSFFCPYPCSLCVPHFKKNSKNYSKTIQKILTKKGYGIIINMYKWNYIVALTRTKRR